MKTKKTRRIMVEIDVWEKPDGFFETRAYAREASFNEIIKPEDFIAKVETGCESRVENRAISHALTELAVQFDRK